MSPPVSPVLPPGISLAAALRPSAAGLQRVAIDWSCDGRRLATAGRGGCEIWEFGDGSPRLGLLFIDEGPRLFQIVWSPSDPDVFVYASALGVTLVRIRPDGHTADAVWQVPYKAKVGNRQGLSFSPSGTSIVAADGGRSLKILRTSDGSVTRTIWAEFNADFVSWSPRGDQIAVAADEVFVGLAELDSPDADVVINSLSSIRSITWSPDGNWCGVASENRIIVMDADGHIQAFAEGHTDGLLGLDFSHDGRLLYSVSMDGTIRCWRTGTWHCAAVLRLGDSHHVLGGLAASPGRSWLARRTQDLARVELYEIDIDRLVDDAPPPSPTYANAKVVLVGDSGVGKSGLGLVLSGQPYAATDSTHARQVWTFADDRVTRPDGGTERREILLWDLAGQPGYRLIHQLHLAEAAVALVVFDARSETDPFAGVRYWARALRQHAVGGPGREVPAFLVAARADRGGVPVSRQRIDALCAELGLAGYVETSAREGRNITELTDVVRRTVDWTVLPRSVSTELFEEIKQFLLDERDSDRVLATADDLFRLFRRHRADGPPAAELRASFDTCIGLLQLRDLVRRLSFGGYVLLRPELLDFYASALIDTARAQPDGLGFLPEEAALAGTFPLPAEGRLAGPEERLLLIAMVEELLRHDLALREPTDGGVDLVFPSQLTTDHPDERDPGQAEVMFHFDGAVQTIYATLAVRLAHVTAYRRDGMWRNASTYRAIVGGTCGLRVRPVEEGRGELTVFFTGRTSEETRFVFEEYVHAHLEARSLPGSVRRERVFTCPGCDYRLPADLVRRRQARGDREMRCPDCEEVRISLLDREDRLGSAARVQDMNASADAGRDRAAATATIRGKEETGDYDVFLSYNSKDREAVRAIADRLRAEGLLPWFDASDLPPGGNWQLELEQQIGRARSGAVFLGPHGLGSWQAMEQRALVDEHAHRPGFRLIPVLLPGAPAGVDLPRFLSQWHAVDFRVVTPDPFERLRWAVTGERPPEAYLG